MLITKYDLKAIISNKFPYNDNKIIILILYESAEYQLVQTVSSIQVHSVFT